MASNRLFRRGSPTSPAQSSETPAAPSDVGRLPAPRLVRTAHTTTGISVVCHDSTLQPFFPFGPQGSSFTVFDVRAAVPVSNTALLPELSKTLPRCPPGGVNFCISDIPPGHSAPMHRTLSLDYGVVLSGEVVLKVDGGMEKTLRAGDFVIQQGTNHEWHNRTSAPARMACFMVGAEKIQLSDGTALEETVFARKPPASE